MTHELSEYKQALKPLRALYGHCDANRFGPLALKAVRDRMVELGWCRGVVNKRVNRLRRVFKWAASEELVSGEVFRSLTTVSGLQLNRTRAREAEPVLPVGVAHVAATRPFLRPEVAAMVEVQLLTGMRPGEACQLRPCDIDTSEAAWVFRPRQHKGRHRGRPRVVVIGPRAQAVLARFAPTDPADYYFSPARAVAALRAERARDRKTPRWRSHLDRNAAKRKPDPKRKPAAKYNTVSYAHAVTRAVVKANRPFVEAAVEVEFHVPHWHPNQLRHAHGTEVRKRYGLEAAGAALGHAKMSATEVYAERDAELAVRVARDGVKPRGRVITHVAR